MAATVTTDLSTSLCQTRRIKPTIRLVVTPRCNFNCSFPVKSGASNKKWCHAEGIGGFSPFPKLRFCPNDPDVSTLLRLCDSLRNLTGSNTVRLAGLEPTLRHDIVELVDGLKRLGFENVGLTTNGSKLTSLAKDLFDAGLDEVNISLHSLDRNIYAKITGHDCRDEVLDGIKRCKELSRGPVKINCVLLRRKGMEGEVRRFLEFAAQNSLLLRLYQLFWSPIDNSWVEKYEVSWKYFFPLWKPFVARTFIDSATLPMRRRITFELTTGATVQVDVFDNPKLSNSDCQSCPYKFQCEEGLLGCGLRVTPDLMLSPCLYREDMSINLRPLCDVSEELEREHVTSELRRRFSNWNITLPIEDNNERRLVVQGGQPNALCVM